MDIKLLSPSCWTDYELIDSGAFEKLERFGRYVIARPEPQAIWNKSLSDARSTEYGGRQREIHHDVANGVFMPFILHNKPPMLWYGRTVAWGTEKTF